MKISVLLLICLSSIASDLIAEDAVLPAGQAKTAKDETDAAIEFRKAAEKGDAAAQNSLGFAYVKGQGVPQDNVESVKWFRKAAQQGLAKAQYNLGFAYYNGYGVPQDYAEAVKWLRMAADQGSALAQENLGFAYLKGQGVPKDEAEAAKWYKKAADQGNAYAQNNLEYYIVNGRTESAPRWESSPSGSSPDCAQRLCHRGIAREAGFCGRSTGVRRILTRRSRN